MRMLLVLLAMVSMVAFGDTHVEDERGLPGRLLGQKRERLKAKKERQRAKRARAAVSAEPEAPQPTCEGHQRVSSLSAVLPDALTPLPTRQILTDRAAKLAHVESMELRPNYLESLKKAGLAPSGKRLYLNLGARGFKDKSTTFFEKYPDASRFEHHAFEATPASMWRETMGWAAAAASDKRIELHNVAVWNKNTTLSFGIRKSASHVVESTSASAKSVFGADKKVSAEYEVTAVDLADFLKRRAAADDFVLIKMDIEGAEYVVVPHLIATGAACLIDEVYLECHTGDSGDIAKGRTYEDCITMLVALRGMGVAAHLWF